KFFLLAHHAPGLEWHLEPPRAKRTKLFAMSSHTCSRCLRSKQGGDRMSSPLSLIADVAEQSEASNLPISPLEGEMSGRTEGGATQ
ncbi:hypothetical protein EOD14_24930, partial [Mesorhizobium sp. M7A.T.Ca.US.000.02.1.1]